MDSLRQRNQRQTSVTLRFLSGHPYFCSATTSFDEINFAHRTARDDRVLFTVRLSPRNTAHGVHVLLQTAIFFGKITQTTKASFPFAFDTNEQGKFQECFCKVVRWRNMTHRLAE